MWEIWGNDHCRTMKQADYTVRTFLGGTEIHLLQVFRRGSGAVAHQRDVGAGLAYVASHIRRN